MTFCEVSCTGQMRDANSCTQVLSAPPHEHERGLWQACTHHTWRSQKGRPRWPRCVATHGTRARWHWGTGMHPSAGSRFPTTPWPIGGRSSSQRQRHCTDGRTPTPAVTPSHVTKDGVRQCLARARALACTQTHATLTHAPMHTCSQGAGCGRSCVWCTCVYGPLTIWALLPATGLAYLSCLPWHTTDDHVMTNVQGANTSMTERFGYQMSAFSNNTEEHQPIIVNLLLPVPN